MAANVETMMYVREKPWHGLGVEVSEAPNSEDALRFAGLDWNVRQENVFNSRGGVIRASRPMCGTVMTAYWAWWEIVTRWCRTGTLYPHCTFGPFY